MSIAPLCAIVVACGGSDLFEAGRQPKGRHFALMEADLAARPQRGFVRVDELAPAPPAKVRLLRPDELTPQLIRLADDMLRNHEGPFGSEAVLDTGKNRYIARFEWHYQYDGNAERAPDWHKGITLYATE